MEAQRSQVFANAGSPSAISNFQEKRHAVECARSRSAMQWNGGKMGLETRLYCLIKYAMFTRFKPSLKYFILKRTHNYMRLRPESLSKNDRNYISPKLCLTPGINSKYFGTGERVEIGQTTVYSLSFFPQNYQNQYCFLVTRSKIIIHQEFQQLSLVSAGLLI